MKKILKIKKQHLQNGITNSFLAEKAGVSISDLYELGDDHIFYRKNFILRISDILEINPQKILYSDNATTG